MCLKYRIRTSILVKVFYKLGIFVGILPFSFDRLKNTVERSRALECYSFFIIQYITIYMSIMYIRTSFIISDVVVIVANFLQLFSVVLNWMVLLICLINNRKTIVDLVNDGLRIEQDFRKKYSSRPWNLYFIFLMFLKDVIFFTGHTYFVISAKRNSGFYFHCYRIISSVIYNIALVIVENLKIISLFYVSHLLRVLNNNLASLSRGKRTNNTVSIREISEMYDRLLIYSENMCKLWRFHMATVLIQILVMTSTEV
jgi:hypothetical protein